MPGNPISRRRALALLASGATGPVWAQGFAGMASDADGFALPAPDPQFAFPRDHGPHPSFRIEWWYVTANLQTPDGTPCGIQWTLFRSALEPREAPGWASPQIWFAHAGMTRPDAHLTAERLSRGGIGQAGARAEPFEAWIDDWHMVSRAEAGRDALDRLDLRARGDGFGYALDLSAGALPLTFHGAGGYSVKHERGQASYYYSQPNYRVQGQLMWPDGPVDVTGRAWLDREWSSQPLDADQTGWDWFSLHLDDGTKLMVYRLRDSGDGYIPGTWIAPGGASEAIPDGAIRLTPLAHTRIGTRRVPTEWRIELPSRGVDITTKPVNAQAWMPLGVSYWEGPVQVAGSHGGTGYLEMTGYD